MSAKQGKVRAADDDWRLMELPVVDGTLCTGCGRCVAVCPTECLALAAYLPWLARPRDCVSCALCVTLCPALALKMETPV